MSNRELVIDLINKLPADTPLHDMAREIEFVAGVKEALAQSEQGEGFRWTKRGVFLICP